MDFSSDLYKDVVAVYIRVIQQDSPEAAAAVQQIQATCDSRAALRATLAITLLKMEVQRNQAPSDVSLYTYMFEDYPEALPLVELAIRCWLRDRSLRDTELGRQQNGHNRRADLDASVPTTDLPPGFEE
jgi:hypothetical protein